MQQGTGQQGSQQVHIGAAHQHSRPDSHADVQSTAALQQQRRLNFQSAQSFSGFRAGYVFKSGLSGLGYYADPGHTDEQQRLQAQHQSPQNSELELPTQTQQATYFFQPAQHFSGARPGYVFTMGSCGLGYYIDSGSADRTDFVFVLQACHSWWSLQGWCSILLATHVQTSACHKLLSNLSYLLSVKCSSTDLATCHRLYHNAVFVMGIMYGKLALDTGS